MIEEGEGRPAAQFPSLNGIATDIRQLQDLADQLQATTADDDTAQLPPAEAATTATVPNPTGILLELTHFLRTHWEVQQATSDEAQEHLERLQTYRRGLAEMWSPETNGTARAYLQRLDALIDQVRQTHDATAASPAARDVTAKAIDSPRDPVLELSEKHQAKLQQEQSHESAGVDPTSSVPEPQSPPSPTAPGVSPKPRPTPTPSKSQSADGPPRRLLGGILGGGGAGTAPTGGAGSRPGGGKGFPTGPTIPPGAN
ncbi:superantigen-like protein SSL4 [Salinispora fenicalii]|uniref:hypothetical protein n=1 Tax=Salinispora fenicalii TaxID=1137263 RepID=UPI0004B45D51|nr:hypothetical protein [Salinispora fenicalii]